MALDDEEEKRRRAAADKMLGLWYGKKTARLIAQRLRRVRQQARRFEAGSAGDVEQPGNPWEAEATDVPEEFRPRGTAAQQTAQRGGVGGQGAVELIVEQLKKTNELLQQILEKVGAGKWGK